MVRMIYYFIDNSGYDLTSIIFFMGKICKIESSPHAIRFFTRGSGIRQASMKIFNGTAD